MFNPTKLLKFKSAWTAFTERHPKFIRYLNVVKDDYIRENSVIDITVTDPNGKALHANLRVNAEDVKVFEELKTLFGSEK